MQTSAKHPLLFILAPLIVGLGLGALGMSAWRGAPPSRYEWHRSDDREASNAMFPDVVFDRLTGETCRTLAVTTGTAVCETLQTGVVRTVKLHVPSPATASTK